MNLFDILSVIAALVIFITAVARLNDIKRTQTTKRWWVRRLGLFLVIVSMVMLISSYFTISAPYWNSIMSLTGLWGFALTWLTTPNMPPWWNYITKHDPQASHDEYQ